MSRELAKAPLCGQCTDGWLEDEDGRPVERCPCRDIAQPAPRPRRRGTQVARVDDSTGGVPERGTRLREVFDLLLAIGDGGATEEGVACTLGQPAAAVSRRVAQLVDRGVVEQAPVEQPTPSGGIACAWRVSAAVRADD